MRGVDGDSMLDDKHRRILRKMIEINPYRHLTFESGQRLRNHCLVCDQYVKECDDYVHIDSRYVKHSDLKDGKLKQVVVCAWCVWESVGVKVSLWNMMTFSGNDHVYAHHDGKQLYIPRGMMNEFEIISNGKLDYVTNRNMLNAYSLRIHIVNNLYKLKDRYDKTTLLMCMMAHDDDKSILCNVVKDVIYHILRFIY